MTPLSIRRPYPKFLLKRKCNFSTEALLSSFGALVILILFAAGICAAITRRLSA